MFKITFGLGKGYDSKEIECSNVVERGYMHHIRYRCKQATAAIRMTTTRIIEDGFVERTNL
jgi:hypothetical protein